MLRLIKIANEQNTSQPQKKTNHILPHLQLLNSIICYEYSGIDGIIVLHFSEELNETARDFCSYFFLQEVTAFSPAISTHVAFESPDTDTFDPSNSLNHITAFSHGPGFLEVESTPGGVTPLNEFCDALREDAYKIAAFMKQEFDEVKSLLENACTRQ